MKCDGALGGPGGLYGILSPQRPTNGAVYESEMK